MKFDLRSVLIIAIGALMAILWGVILMHNTYRCPDGHGVFLPTGGDVRKICEQTKLDSKP
jgi:hypothetical protein